MGRYHRRKPARLAEKLRVIRLGFGLSQNQMLKKLGLENELTRDRISGYELGTREPSLITLLKYARAANVPMEILVDDELNLPEGF